jgi:hypothetical protein
MAFELKQDKDILKQEINCLTTSDNLTISKAAFTLES